MNTPHIWQGDAHTITAQLLQPTPPREATTCTRPTFVAALGPRSQPAINGRHHEQVVALLPGGDGAAAGGGQCCTGPVCGVLLGASRERGVVAEAGCDGERRRQAAQGGAEQQELSNASIHRQGGQVVACGQGAQR